MSWSKKPRLCLGPPSTQHRRPSASCRQRPKSLVSPVDSLVNFSSSCWSVLLNARFPAKVKWNAGGRGGVFDLIHAPDANPNFRLDLAAFHHYLQGLHQPVAVDLIRIAAHVYVADTSVSRGSDTDVFGAGWTREFQF